MSDTKPGKKPSDKDVGVPGEPNPEALPHGTTTDQIAEMESEGQAQEPEIEGATPEQDTHEGATDTAVGDRTGPGAGYDKEPEQKKDQGGVA
jgi:hypothetical protein